MLQCFILLAISPRQTTPRGGVLAQRRAQRRVLPAAFTAARGPRGSEENDRSVTEDTEAQPNAEDTPAEFFRCVSRFGVENRWPSFEEPHRILLFLVSLPGSILDPEASARTRLVGFSHQETCGMSALLMSDVPSEKVAVWTKSSVLDPSPTDTPPHQSCFFFL